MKANEDLLEICPITGCEKDVNFITGSVARSAPSVRRAGRMATHFTESDTGSLTFNDEDYKTIGDVFVNLHHSTNCGHAMCEDYIEASKNMLGICPATACEDVM